MLDVLMTSLSIVKPNGIAIKENMNVGFHSLYPQAGVDLSRGFPSG